MVHQKEILPQPTYSNQEIANKNFIYKKNISINSIQTMHNLLVGFHRKNLPLSSKRKIFSCFEKIFQLSKKI